VADDVIENAGGLAQLEARVATLHQRYLSLAASGNAL
jgi:dephospho-CoA kinase